MLKQHDRNNFNTLQRAFDEGVVALVESRDSAGRYVALVCAMQENRDSTITPVPFAEMVRGNPFELYADPTALELPAPSDSALERLDDDGAPAH